MAPLYLDGVLQSGFPATQNERRLVYAPIREAILNILGSTGIIIPMGDTQHEATDYTTVTTVGEEQLVFTYAPGARTAFATPMTFKGPAQIPIIKLNGTSEYATTPDVTYLSRGDGTNDFAMSVGVWIYAQAGTTERSFLSKNSGTPNREWDFKLDAQERPFLNLWDESAGVVAQRYSTAAIPLNAWSFIMATYDGTGGATAANGMLIYNNGAAVASTAGNNASYVATENLAAVVGLGYGAAEGYFDNLMAGGPLGPFYVQAALSADAVKRIYQLGRTAMGV